jgi:hypothetical protein
VGWIHIPARRSIHPGVLLARITLPSTPATLAAASNPAAPIVVCLFTGVSAGVVAGQPDIARFSGAAAQVWPLMQTTPEGRVELRDAGVRRCPAAQDRNRASGAWAIPYELITDAMKVTPPPFVAVAVKSKLFLSCSAESGQSDSSWSQSDTGTFHVFERRLAPFRLGFRGSSVGRPRSDWVTRACSSMC